MEKNAIVYDKHKRKREKFGFGFFINEIQKEKKQ
jgi:hypothetical protein